jgi:hypothetical protein
VAQDVFHAGRTGCISPPNHGYFLIEQSLDEECRFDYESFTDSWSTADMNAGVRIPRMWVRCANHITWDDPKMTQTEA